MVLHLDQFYPFDRFYQVSGFIVNAHLSAEAAWVMVGDGNVLLGAQIHLKALFDQEFRGVHDLDAIEFVISGKGAETLGTTADQGVDTTGEQLLLIVGL